MTTSIEGGEWGEVWGNNGNNTAKRGLLDEASSCIPAKRAVWESTHRMFVAAIYKAGIKHASPSVIMENMTLSHKAITSERVKSHLQKYRNNEKNRKRNSWANTKAGCKRL